MVHSNTVSFYCKKCFSIMSSCWLWPKDFVHITGECRLLSLTDPHSTPCSFSSSSPSSSSSTPYMFSFSSPSQTVSIYSWYQHSVHLHRLNCLVLYSWINHITRNKCEQVIVCKWWHFCLVFSDLRSKCITVWYVF